MQDSARGRVKWNGLSVPAEVDLLAHPAPHASFLDEVRTGLAGHPGAFGGQYTFPGPPRRRVSRKLRRAFSEAEDADIPVLRVAPDGTLLYANRVGTEFLKRSGCRFGEHIPRYPECLRIRDQFHQRFKLRCACFQRVSLIKTMAVCLT
jgi:hypothetical protein